MDSRLIVGVVVHTFDYVNFATCRPIRSVGPDLLWSKHTLSGDKIGTYRLAM